MSQFPIDADGNTTLVFTPAAIEVLSRMQRRLSEVEYEYGQDSKQYGNLADSFIYSILTLIRNGGRVMRDDDLALVSDGTLYMGLIFHANYRNGERDPLLGSWSCHT